MTSSAPVSLRDAGQITWLRIERPERMNALDRPTYRALHASLEQAASGRARVIVLTGAGGAFSAGADLKARQEDPGAADVGRTLREWANPMLRAIRTAPQPVIAAVNGPAIGIGCALALTCDLVVAAECAWLSLPFARLGLGPDGGVPMLVTARAGFGRAAELLLLGERLSAQHARECGLVDRVFDDARFAEEVTATAGQVASASPHANAAIKRALGRRLDETLELEMEVEADQQGELARGRDHRESVAAFAEGRTPRFGDR